MSGSWFGPWWLWVFVFGLIFGAALFLSATPPCGSYATPVGVTR